MCQGCSFGYAALAAAAAALALDESLASDNRSWAINRVANYTPQIPTFTAETPSITIKMPAKVSAASMIQQAKIAKNAI